MAPDRLGGTENSILQCFFTNNKETALSSYWLFLLSIHTDRELQPLSLLGILFEGQCWARVNELLVDILSYQ
jgi:hypothetical protein